eukprot:1194694-Prorocentrum_minimum.AAC.8
MLGAVGLIRSGSGARSEPLELDRCLIVHYPRLPSIRLSAKAYMPVYGLAENGESNRWTGGQADRWTGGQARGPCRLGHS